MFSVLQSQRGTYSVLSQQSMDYAFCIRSGNYIEVRVGSRKECEDWVHENANQID